MIYEFTSRATGNMVMTQPVAERLLKLIGKHPGPQGIITVAGQQSQCMDSPVSHAFDFTPSVSLFVRCESEEEQQRVWAALSEGGSQLMPFGDYGFGPFGWCNDRFGVSWQVARA